MLRLRTFLCRSHSFTCCNRVSFQSKTSKWQYSKDFMPKRRAPTSSKWSHSSITSSMSYMSSLWLKLLPRAQTRQWSRTKSSTVSLSDGLKASSSTMSWAWTFWEADQFQKNVVISIAIKSSASAMTTSWSVSSLWSTKQVAWLPFRTLSCTTVFRVSMSTIRAQEVCHPKWCTLQWLKRIQKLDCPSTFSSDTKAKTLELFHLRQKVSLLRPKVWLMVVSTRILTKRLRQVMAELNRQLMVSLKAECLITMKADSQMHLVLSISTIGLRLHTFLTKVKSLKNWLQLQIQSSTTIS